MRRRWILTSKQWKMLVVVLLVAAFLDSYALIRAYAASNADAVTIVVNGSYGIDYHDAAGQVVAAPDIQTIIHLRYTGALAQRIQRLFLTSPDRVANCSPSVEDTVYRYSYSLTFTLGGVPLESAHTSVGGCEWMVMVLGSPSGFMPGTPFVWDTGGLITSTINMLTHGAFPTPDHPLYA